MQGMQSPSKVQKPTAPPARYHDVINFLAPCSVGILKAECRLDGFRAVLAAVGSGAANLDETGHPSRLRLVVPSVLPAGRLCCCWTEAAASSAPAPAPAPARAFATLEMSLSGSGCSSSGAVVMVTGPLSRTTGPRRSKNEEMSLCPSATSDFFAFRANGLAVEDDEGCRSSAFCRVSCAAEPWACSVFLAVVKPALNGADENCDIAPIVVGAEYPDTGLVDSEPRLSFQRSSRLGRFEKRPWSILVISRSSSL